MTSSRRSSAIGLLLAGLLAHGSPAVAAPECQMAEADRAWLAEAIGHWRAAEIGALGLEAASVPQVVAIDAACTFTIFQGDLGAMKGIPHKGKVRLPDDGSVPAGPIAFAGFNGAPYFVMSLPSVWRDAGVTSMVGLERFLHGVLLHEMMHTRQVEMAHGLVRNFAMRAGFGRAADLTDDFLQEQFGGDARYVAAWQAERDLFFAAATAPDDETARTLAAQGLTMMRARHARWFTGRKAAFRDLDGIFLSMEGMGQWLAFRFLLSEAGGKLPPRLALEAVRRDRKQWSQDQGLAVILVVDRLLPDWQERAVRDPDWRADRLLEAALES